MLDADIAILYGVPTKVLNQAVKRNERRFPPDFVFFLTKEEKYELVTNCDRLRRLKHSSVLPRAFTEQGVAMLEKRIEGHDDEIKIIFQAIRQLITAPEKPRKKIGFVVKEKQRAYRRLKS